MLNPEILQELLRRQGDRCSICGEDNVRLELHHIKPLSQGGNDSIENLSLVCRNCHANMHTRRELREFEFEAYLLELLQRSTDFRNVRAGVEIGRERHLRADLVAEERVDGQWREIVVECKGQSSFTIPRLRDIVTQLGSYRGYMGRATLVLAFPGELSPAARLTFENSGIEIWDLSYLSNRFKQEIPNVPHPILQPLLMATKVGIAISREELLMKELKSCKPGKRDWVRYQEVMRRILERLFCPLSITTIFEPPLTTYFDPPG